jgi:hypothetical protein
MPHDKYIHLASSLDAQITAYPAGSKTRSQHGTAGTEDPMNYTPPPKGPKGKSQPHDSSWPYKESSYTVYVTCKLRIKKKHSCIYKTE